MKCTITIFKQGFLNSDHLQIIKDRVGNFGIAEEHVREAVQDMEINVYLRWVLAWLDKLDKPGHDEVKQYLKDHQQDENPIVDFLLNKFGQDKLKENVPELIQQVLSLQREDIPTNIETGDILQNTP